MQIIGKMKDTLMGRAIGILIADSSDGSVIKKVMYLRQSRRLENSEPLKAVGAARSTSLVRAAYFSATPEPGDARFGVRRLGAAFVERARSKAASSCRTPKRFAQARANDAML